MTPELRETWTVRKPAVRSDAGVVSTQHHLASEIGARVLAEGGNAVDAAVTAGLALGTVEPWMSGLGGLRADDRPPRRRGPRVVGRLRTRGVLGHLDPADYPLDEGRGSDLFNWPAVAGDRNVMGPLSIAVPTWVAGAAAALERFGTRSWADCIAPAVELAERGLFADWYATLKIASTAARLAADDECRRVYLPGGFPPCSEWGGPPPRLRLGSGSPRPCAGSGKPAPGTSTRARSPARSSRTRSGSERSSRPTTSPGWRSGSGRRSPSATATRPSTRLPVSPAGRASRGRSALLAERRAEAGAKPGRRPKATLALAYADALSTAYAERLAVTGHDAEAAMPACTTHLSVVDREGNLVALTQTLLSLFGSRVMFPATGVVLMNNGVMWFDPRSRPPELDRSRTPAARQHVPGGGGAERRGPLRPRRVGGAAYHARGDAARLVSRGLRAGPGRRVPRPAHRRERRRVVTVDPRFPAEVAAALRERYPVEAWPNAVYPAMYACPNGAGALRGRRPGGAAYVMSPWALAAPAEPA